MINENTAKSERTAVSASRAILGGPSWFQPIRADFQQIFHPPGIRHFFWAIAMKNRSFHKQASHRSRAVTLAIQPIRQMSLPSLVVHLRVVLAQMYTPRFGPLGGPPDNDLRNRKQIL